MKFIGERIRALRRGAKWTQEDLATGARISVSYISMIERGERIPTLDTLRDLAVCFGAPLESLVTAPAESQDDVEVALLGLRGLVRARGLTAQDIHQLLDVARAMFVSRSAS